MVPYHSAPGVGESIYSSDEKTLRTKTTIRVNMISKVYIFNLVNRGPHTMLCSCVYEQSFTGTRLCSIHFGLSVVGSHSMT